MYSKQYLVSEACDDQPVNNTGYIRNYQTILSSGRDYLNITKE